MISIIIPIYNGEKYIMNCYDSLLRQTFKDWEAIFIDDGSEDKSLIILKSIIDSRVKVIEKDNEGVAIAREKGIKNALGEFITFLDIDDTLDSQALELFIKTFATSGADIVVGGINIVSEAGKKLTKINYAPMLITETKAVKLICTGKLRWQLCGKAFRTALFLDVITPMGLRSAEDMAVCLQAITNAKNVAVISKCIYNYIQVATSVTHSKAREISYDALKAAEFVEMTIGDKMDTRSLDSLFLLIISGALRSKISANDSLFRTAVKTHGCFKSLTQISLLKAINIGIFKYLHVNLAQFL